MSKRETLGGGFRVSRHCPRCRFHSYHWALRLASRARHHNIKINCNNCGHEWYGRGTRDEIPTAEEFERKNGPHGWLDQQIGAPNAPDSEE